MSDRINNTERPHRGAEGNWRARGRGRGRGRIAGTTPSRGQAASFGNKYASAGTPQLQSSDPVVARIRMNLMASVSRSSGHEKDGDDLKNYQTQEEYRRYIQEKVDHVLENHPRRPDESEDHKTQRKYAQENVLILFRKLREGVSSAGRKDTFALEAYETSLYLSVIFESPKQTISIIPHLFPPNAEPPAQFTGRFPSVQSLLSSLLHHLVASYPSQGTYHQHLASIPRTALPQGSQISLWLTSVTKSLRTRNYAKFSILSQKATVAKLLESSTYGLATNPRGPAEDVLATNAVFSLVQALRRKASETAWNVLRSAYRELDQGSTDMETWLTNSLFLDSVMGDEWTVKVNDWLETKTSLGHVRRKENTVQKWIVCKVR